MSHWDAQPLLGKAESLTKRGLLDEALKELDLALQLQPGCHRALWLRAEAHAAAGAHSSCFLDLRRLADAAPGFPGVLQALSLAAVRCAAARRAESAAAPPPPPRYAKRPGPAGGAQHCQPPAGGPPVARRSREEHLRVLGLRPGATAGEVRGAYKALAVKLHPDKCRGGEAERAAAGEAFREVVEAYRALAG